MIIPPKVKSRLLIVALWLTTTATTFIVSMYTFQVTGQTQVKSSASSSNTVMAYAALPATVSEVSTKIITTDARPPTIEAYLKAYNSPLQGLGDFIVKTSDKHAIDPYFVVAIAQQESNLCKIIPDDSHNCWGWGIHSEGTLKFDSYEQAAQTVIRGLKENYFDKGYTTPEEIMAKYTPQSNGSWARGINQFLTELKSGNF